MFIYLNYIVMEEILKDRARLDKFVKTIGSFEQEVIYEVLPKGIRNTKTNEVITGISKTYIDKMVFANVFIPEVMSTKLFKLNPVIDKKLETNIYRCIEPIYRKSFLYKGLSLEPTTESPINCLGSKDLNIDEFFTFIVNNGHPYSTFYKIENSDEYLCSYSIDNKLSLFK